MNVKMVLEIVKKVNWKSVGKGASLIYGGKVLVKAGGETFKKGIPQELSEEKKRVLEGMAKVVIPNR